jgi:hypothetical protein
MRHPMTTATVFTIAVAMALALSLAPGQSRAQEAKGAPAVKAQPKQQPHPLVGTWKLVSAKYGGNASDLPTRLTMVKHVTPTQFMWARYDKDGKVSAAAGGSYKIDGDKYAETPEYGLSADFDEIKGKTHAFTWKVEGAKWYSNGALASGLTIEEVWERVEGK